MIPSVNFARGFAACLAALTWGGIGTASAFVQTGDAIEVDVPARRIHLDVAEEELNRRRAAWKAPAPRYLRGYGAMFSAHIGQADEGCDFDFLAGKGQIPEPEIH